MKFSAFLFLAATFAAPAWAGDSRPCGVPDEPGASRQTLRAFSDEAQLTALLKCLQEEAKKRMLAERSRQSSMYAQSMSVGAAPPMSVPAPAPAAAAKAEAGAAADAVTNVQTAGVDEGGIVKVHGKHLVILRRGRLFTVNVGDGELKPVASVDAFAPDADPRGAWYDEMLIANDTIVVIGYSYARGGTELGLFDIDGAGRLAYRATYHLRSNDYYSSRNYASRLIGNKLIFYTPLYLNLYGDDFSSAFPALRRWRKDATPADFKRIAPATRIYRSDDPLEPDSGLALHTVSVCDLGKEPMSCQATAVMGPRGRVFYVSANAVYVWTTNYRSIEKSGATRSAVFRIPLDVGAPTALKTAGAPIDQFSFLESDDAYLNVLLKSEAKGEAMWSSENAPGDTALLRVALDRFGDGRDTAPREAYRRLPNVNGYATQNRYVGKYLLYGSGRGWGAAPGERQNLYALRWDERDAPVFALPLDHAVERIEAMGGNAVAIGTQGSDLLFTAIRLGREAGIANVYTRKDAAQGETRSHGFFYQGKSESEGIIGLPIARAGRAGLQQLKENSAALLFVKNQNLRFSELGSLVAQSGVGQNDDCRASCVDWYGNARPLFLKGRMFALLGYELVEGRLNGSGVEEVRRVSFAPQAIRISR